MTKRPGTWLTLFPEGRSPGNDAGLFIKASEKRVVVEDIPESVIDLFEADVLVIEGLA